MSRLLAFSLYNTGAAIFGLGGADAVGRALLVERLPRKVLSYLVMSPTIGMDDLAALLCHAMRFRKTGGVLIEAIATRKVVEAAPPVFLEAFAGYLLQVRQRLSVFDRVQRSYRWPFRSSCVKEP